MGIKTRRSKAEKHSPPMINSIHPAMPLTTAITTSAMQAKIPAMQEKMILQGL